MLDVAQLSAVAVVSLFLFGLSFIRRSNAHGGYNLPPGPPGLPLLGNLLDIPGKVYSPHPLIHKSDLNSIASINVLPKIAR